MTNHLQHISDLTEICRLKGIKHVVVSPGSRNNPLIRSFYGNPAFKLHSIVDERSAAYYGMGISLAANEPVALICTSGTAVLNYSPALAEAYYQHIPLIAITADRPGELIDQQDSQTIQQINVFQNFVKGSIHIKRLSGSLIQTEQQNIAVDQIINKALSGIKGPVHINVPVSEPLNISLPLPSPSIRITNAEPLECIIPEQFIKLLNNSSRRMILCGQNSTDPLLNKIISLFAENETVVILAEPISNITSEKIYSPTDRLFAGLEIKENPEYLPDLLISFGGHVISRNLKKWFQLNKDLQHWRISEKDDNIDTYKNLKGRIIGNPAVVFSEMKTPNLNIDKAYINKWAKLNKERTKKHYEFLQDIPYSDLFVFNKVMNNLPEGCVLHLANSSPVRYAQLFDTSVCKGVYSNRGVSGIDGSLSTAAGFANASEEINLLITGDLSFVYDSNGLWNRNLSPKLRIIVINNQGGGIFRLISKETDEKYFQDYIETNHKVNIQKLSEAFGIEYYFCDDKSELKEIYQSFINTNNGPALLEIKTPKFDNAEVYHEYFRRIKQKIEDEH